MLDPTTLNAQGVRVRQALDVLRATVIAPQQALSVAYAYATFSNLMKALEEDAGVQPGYFGSQGAALLEVNPFSGVAMPRAVSGEPAPLVLSNPDENPPVVLPDQLPTF